MNEGQLPLDPQWLLHRPITGPRNGHIGEQVFCEKWIELQQREVEFQEVDEPEHTTKLARIIINARLPEIGERECTVAASWACYLGCNIGASVIHLGDRLRTVPAPIDVSLRRGQSTTRARSVSMAAIERSKSCLRRRIA